jgi:hypothetical protein
MLARLVPLVGIEALTAEKDSTVYCQMQAACIVNNIPWEPGQNL